jgi:indolepyruvate ferredoxin oxidoreductase
VLQVAAEERVVAHQQQEIVQAVSRYLYKLMAYKDEYEVARLHLKPEFAADVRATFAKPERLTFHLA